MLSSPPRCLVRGSINIDEVFALPHIVLPGETISSTSFTRKAGGKGANQAFAVARAGGAVVLDGNVGLDGVWVRALLEKEGVDVSRVTVLDDEPSGRAIIQSAADGENSIVLYKGANYHLPPSSGPATPLSSFTHLLLQNEIPLPSTLAYLAEAARCGVTAIFNPSPMLSVAELRAFPWAQLGWLIVNEGELESLLSALSGAEPGPPTAQEEAIGSGSSSVEARARGKVEALQQMEGCQGLNVICTLGANGILYSVASSGEIGHLPAARLRGPVVDTTGAGDCFAGYFVAGMMRRQGEPLADILQTCLTACAMCVEKAGAMESYATRAEVVARMSLGQ